MHKKRGLDATQVPVGVCKYNFYGVSILCPFTAASKISLIVTLVLFIWNFDFIDIQIVRTLLHIDDLEYRRGFRWL